MLPIALLIAVTVGAQDLNSDNFETVIRTYVANRSDGGSWVTERGGAPLRLVMDRVDKLSITHIGKSQYAGLVRFKRVERRGFVHAEFVTDLGGDLWKVSRYALLTDAQAAQWRPPAPLPDAQGAPSRSGRAPLKWGDDVIPNVELEDENGALVPVGACAKPRCVLMFVDPWEPSALEIAVFRGELAARDVPLRVAVGMDQPLELRRRAKQLGHGTLMDVDQILIHGRLPAFIVHSDGGKILGHAAVNLREGAGKAATKLLGR